MTNKEFLKKSFPNQKEDDGFKNALAVMEKYGDDKWWLSNDLIELAYRQMNEPCLIIPFDRFHCAVEALVGHPVFSSEFGFNFIKSEVNEAYKKLKEQYHG